MKIEFDKALALIVPYLYLVSIMYYWGYWGTLDIDVYNYYPISDLIKGITAPLGATLPLTVTFGVSLFFYKNRIRHTLFNPNKKIIRAIIFLLFMFISLSIYIDYNASEYLKGNYFISNNISGIVAVFLMVIAVVISEKHMTTSSIVSNIRIPALFFILHLPCQSYLTGLRIAWNIRDDIEFKYVVTDSVAGVRSIYKYMGKVGDYHILMTTDNAKQIIVPADKLTPLIVERFAAFQPGSRQEFALLVKQLRTSSSQSSKPK